MVKIIATDMDGTLLDSKKRLPKDFGYVLEKLDEKNEKNLRSDLIARNGTRNEYDSFCN